jgi:hypothetical protein
LTDREPQPMCTPAPIYPQSTNALPSTTRTRRPLRPSPHQQHSTSKTRRTRHLSE